MDRWLEYDWSRLQRSSSELRRLSSSQSLSEQWSRWFGRGRKAKRRSQARAHQLFRGRGCRRRICRICRDL